MYQKGLKKLKWSAATAAVVAMTGMTALGAEFTTPDAVLTLETPGDDWRQISDTGTWVTLTDGTDRITMLHYSYGEKLPEITVAGNGYAQTCQSIISTENEVFIITGSAVEKESFDAVREAVQSAAIQKYDTKEAVQPGTGMISAGQLGAGAVSAEQPELQSDGMISAEGLKQTENFTAWVTSQQLNVRSQSSTSSSILGILYFMDAVNVTGIANDWYQIDYNGAKGYVYSQYVSSEPYTAETLGYTLTNEKIMLYTDGGGTAAYIYRATNGNWYDGSGREFQQEGEGTWTCLSSGSIWQDSNMIVTAESLGYTLTSDQITLYTNDGNTATYVNRATNGNWYDGSGREYQKAGKGVWMCVSDGTSWTE